MENSWVQVYLGVEVAWTGLRETGRASVLSVPCWRAGRAPDPAQGWPSAWTASTSLRTRFHSHWDCMSTPSPGPVRSDLSTEHNTKHTFTERERESVCSHVCVYGCVWVPLHKRTVWRWIHRADYRRETSWDTPTDQSYNTHNDRFASNCQSQHRNSKNSQPENRTQIL